MRQYITVELTARVSGEELVVIDAYGRKIGRVAKCDASKIPYDVLEQIEEGHEFSGTWRQCFMLMMSSNAARRCRGKRTEWEKKIGVWLSAIRMRRNRPEFQKQSTERRQSRWISKRPDWESACGLMLQRHNAKKHKKKLRQANPWRVWTETVVANMKQRRRRHEENKASRSPYEVRPGGHATGTGFQVCFDWDSINTANSVA